MKYIHIPDTSDQSVPFYLSVEEWVAYNLPDDEYFFAWQIPPTVICGRHQEIGLEVDLDEAECLGVQVWRRKSGGGAVFADWNNVMFSHITPSSGVQTSFDGYTSKICAMLKSLGIDARPSGRNDITVGGKKVAGNAFYGVPGHSIVHGTMLYDTDFGIMGRVLTPSRAKVESKGVKSVPSRLTTLRNERLSISCIDFISKALEFLGDGGVVELTAKDLGEIREIMRTYTDPAFLKKDVVKATVSSSAYVDGTGLVKANLKVGADGHIKQAEICGDFFPLTDVKSSITDKLTGISFSREAIKEAIDKTDVPSAISNLSNEQLLKILTQNIMKKTCLHHLHTAQGALMSPFGGFDMPISYEGIEAEHRAVRNSVGVFDVSHMGEVLITGPQATKFVNRIFTGDISPLAPGKVVYGMMLNDHGGTVDDLLVYKRGDSEYFLVINAANIDKDVEWIRKHAAEYDVTVDDQCDFWSELAIQGPEAENTIKNVLGVDGSDLTFYTFKDLQTADGKPVVLSRTGYTGEDGFEFYAPAEVIVDAWKKLMDAGVAPCGLGCRDTLRFEAGLPLYGDELTDEISPLEAGLGMFAKIDKEGFIGREALVAQKAEGLKRKIVGLEVDGRAIPRHGYDVLDMDGNKVGEITTGYHSITLDRNIAMALIDSRFAGLDTRLQVQVRRKIFPAKVIKKRFYTPNYKRN